MEGLKFGNITVPLVKTFDYETGIVSALPTFSDYEMSYEELFSKGRSVGTMESPPRDSGDLPSNENYLRHGVTPMENGGIMEVDITRRQPSGDYGYTYTANVHLGTPEDPTAYPTYNQSSDYLFSITGTTYRGYYTTVMAVGSRFSFQGETDPRLKRYGYHIMFIYAQTVKEPDGGYVTTDYGQYGSNIYILIPQLNRDQDTDYYINEEVIPDEENPFEPSEPQDYAPVMDDTSDTIDLPTDPPIGVTGSGFINVYKPSIGALHGLGDILFPSPSASQDVPTMLLTLCETIANSNLINYVIDCHVIPVAPNVGNNAEIKVGYRMTGISVPVVTSDYVDFSCGTLSLAEYYGGAQDYTATRSKLYIPFVGFVDMKPEFWQAGVIGVDYKFNVIDGSFMAYIRSTSSKSQLTGSVIAQYAGNACMHFPVTGVNYANMVSGLVGAVTAPAAIKGASAVLGGAYSAANAITGGGSVQQSNGYNATASILGVRTPYLMIERAVPSVPSYFNHDKGYPSNITTGLANVSGYTEIEDIDLSGIPLTQVELDELRGLLKEGVYF